MKTATLLSAALALAAGYVYGDERRRRQHAESYAAELLEMLTRDLPQRQRSLLSWPTS